MHLRNFNWIILNKFYALSMNILPISPQGTHHSDGSQNMVVIAKETEGVSFFGWCGKKCRRFSLLAAQVAIFALDIFFFAGKMTNKIPSSFTSTSLVILSGTGFIAFPYHFHFIRKLLRDAIFAFHSGNKLIILISVSKIIELASNIGLTTSSFVAAVAGQQENDKMQTSIYMSTMEYGIAILILGQLMNLIYMAMDRQLLRMLTPETINTHSNDIKRALVEEIGSSPPIEQVDLQEPLLEVSQVPLVAKQLAARIRCSMDKDTLEDFLDRLKKLYRNNIQELDPERQDMGDLQKELFGKLKENIQTQLGINLGWKLFLNICGDIAMGVEKYYTPNSLTAASINLTSDLLYTLQISVENRREARQRSHLSRIMNSMNRNN